MIIVSCIPLQIADFGVSEFFVASDADLTKTAGSPAFMAPESLLREKPLICLLSFCHCSFYAQRRVKIKAFVERWRQLMVAVV